MADKRSVLIFTAGFGEGHNAAARNLAAALREGGEVEVEVVDLFEDAAPWTGGFYKWLYRQVINHQPGLWRWFYERARTADFASLWWDRWVGLGPALERRLAAHRPQLAMLTYPIYPYFLARLGAPELRPEAVWMAVTDSITIHPVWLRGKVDRLYVTDEFSRAVAEAGLAEAVPVEVSGFPVATAFAGFPARAAEAVPGCLRVLYFATTASGHVRRTLRGLCESLPEGARLTVVMGRHVGRLGPVVAEWQEAFPGVPVVAIGWTDRVPELLMEHDVVISKAGGATVHECLAAGVPVMVNYIIPGQEEGNVELLERLGCGVRSLVPEETGAMLRELVDTGSLAAMRRAMAGQRRPEGAWRIARDIRQALEG